ncbi:MBL fold metallo-hydrolase [Actinomadura parmotrematis]|uniref:MBL fold metallo-hydrolase n=1 Tax=Actinomadura parmotrematis TaxID=2864039 RepID=A0ABS7FVX4_9ACTN|nr:MBL fold metallo-hydrolase [Actinomadura parmotrematis]MBW8483834.1 MBL fold metallo-hydrolase [Actinomadura parmotrematis]
MRVTVIGCSGSYPGPESPASSYLVQADGFSLLLDLGSGALGTLQRFHPLYDIDAVCISHLHADHCLDLCGYWVARTYCPHGPLPRIPVHGPAGTALHMARAYDLDPEPGMTGTFEFRELERGPYEIGPFRVTTALMPHPIEAYSFRIEHAGKVLAYSGDTGVCDTLVDMARDADLFLCEASFLDGDNPDDLHLSAREAGDHAARAGAARLVLTHLVPWNDNEATLKEAKGSGYEGEIDLARVGAVYDL